MEAYPRQQNVQPKEQKVCQWPDCGKSYIKFKYLNRHLQSSHEVSADDMYGHWLQKAEFLEGKGWAFVGQEANCLGLAWQEDGTVDEMDVLCRICHKKLSKRGLQKHLTNVHPFVKEDVSSWLAIKDANAIKKHKGSQVYLNAHLYFAVAVLMAEEPGIGRGLGEGFIEEPDPGSGSSQEPNASEFGKPQFLDLLEQAANLANAEMHQGCEQEAVGSRSQSAPPAPAGCKKEVPAEAPPLPDHGSHMAQLIDGSNHMAQLIELSLIHI